MKRDLRIMNSMSLTSRIVFGRLVQASAVALCVSAFHAQARGEELHRPHERVPAPVLTVTPQEATIRSGESISFNAEPRGGEAMRFTVEWVIINGRSLGDLKVEQVPDERFIGSRARFIAKDAAVGTVRIVARLHEFPKAYSAMTVHIIP